MKDDRVQGILFDAKPEVHFISGRSAGLLRIRRMLHSRKQTHAHAAIIRPTATPVDDRAVIAPSEVAMLSRRLRHIEPGQSYNRDEQLESVFSV